MTTIHCIEKCLHQREGFCTLNHVEKLPGQPQKSKSGCPHYLSKTN